MNLSSGLTRRCEFGRSRQHAGRELVGPHGSVTLAEGVICARRHIHMNPLDAQHFGITDSDTVSVRIDSDGRDLTFGDVSVRIAPEFSLELHLDTDEANAAQVTAGAFAELIRPASGHSDQQIGKLP